MLKLYRILFYLLISSLLWTCSCNPGKGLKTEAVVTIGDTAISRKEMHDEIEHLIHDMGITDQDAKTGIKSIINKIVEKNLILEYGRKNGITVSPEELDAAVKTIKRDYPDDVFRETLLKRYIDIKEWKKNLNKELLIKKIVNKALANSINVTFEEVKEYYENHQDEFRHPRMVQLRQIVTKTRDDMETVLNLLKNGESMAELAKKYSIAPEAQNEGVLNWIEKGKLDEKTDKIVFSLKVGELSPILESPYGFHLFKVLAVKKEGIDEFPEVMKDIESKISMEKREIMYAKWLDALKKEFPVSIKESQILADMNMED